MKWLFNLLGIGDDPSLGRSTHPASQAPAVAPTAPAPLIPPPPAMKQEQFADLYEIAHARAMRTQLLYKRVVATNNSNVTRVFGAGLPPVSFAPSERSVRGANSLTDADMKELASHDFKFSEGDVEIGHTHLFPREPRIVVQATALPRDEEPIGRYNLLTGYEESKP